jgi:hypothetical protein
MFGLLSVAVWALTCAQPAAQTQITTTAAQIFAGSPRITSAAQAVQLTPQMTMADRRARTSRSGALTTMYVAFAGLQAMDAHSTLTALSNGGREANPVMRGVVEHPGRVIAVKAAAGATTIWLTEKMRKEHPRGAVVLMAIINSAMATIVAHNYSLR